MNEKINKKIKKRMWNKKKVDNQMLSDKQGGKEE